jgi:hypothetical protein
MYKLTNLEPAAGVLRVADNAFIPFDPAKTDYAEYLQWLAEGNEPLPADSAPPAPPPRFTSLEFLDLFTTDEQLAVVTASMANAAVKLWYDRTLAASFITISDLRTEAGLTALASAGLLTAARKTAIVEAMQ